MSGLREWLLGMLAAAMLGMVCTALGGEDRPVLRLTTGLVLLLALCSPVFSFDLGDLSQLLAQTRAEAEAITSDTGDALRERISEQTSAYILDKAAEMGLALSVEVTVVEGEFYPYPAAVTLTGRTTTAQRSQINRWLQTELAIAEEDIAWNEVP